MYRKIIEKKYPQLSVVKENNDSAQWKTEKGNVFLSRVDDTVVLIEGAPYTMVEQLIKKLSLKKDEPATGS